MPVSCQAVYVSEQTGETPCPPGNYILRGKEQTYSVCVICTLLVISAEDNKQSKGGGSKAVRTHGGSGGLNI